MISIPSFQYCDRAKQPTAIFKWIKEAKLGSWGEKRQYISVGNGGPYSITCEIINNVSGAPGVPYTILGYAHFDNM